MTDSPTNSDEKSTDGTDQSPTFLRRRGVRRRMQCSGQAATRIEETFVTVGQLVDAVQSDDPLTEHDGIGPKTAEVIGEWWANRFELEEKMDSSTVERTGRKTASIHFHSSWEEELGENDG